MSSKHLDEALKTIERMDIRIKESEEQKQKALNAYAELLDLAVVSSHTLKNGFTAKPDNRHKVFVKDKKAFMKWLKNNKSPDEVIDFICDSIGVTKLKRFCEKEFNDQRDKGNMVPEIDGIVFGDLTYRRLTTLYKRT